MQFQMLKDASILPPCLLPPQVLPSGLDDERRRYLHKEIGGPSSTIAFPCIVVKLIFSTSQH